MPLIQRVLNGFFMKKKPNFSREINHKKYISNN